MGRHAGSRNLILFTYWGMIGVAPPWWACACPQGHSPLRDCRPPLLSILPPAEDWRAACRVLPIDVGRAEVLVAGERRRLMPQQQAVLAVLLVHETGTRDRLISAVWGAWLETPARMSSALRLIMTGVRRVLAGTGAEIVTLPGRGWRLVVAGNDDWVSGDKGA